GSQHVRMVGHSRVTCPFQHWITSLHFVLPESSYHSFDMYYVFRYARSIIKIYTKNCMLTRLESIINMQAPSLTVYFFWMPWRPFSLLPVTLQLLPLLFPCQSICVL
ncbi:hypothetical protein GOP47_0003362, partial [Adiantum capillus-veneris]